MSVTVITCCYGTRHPSFWKSWWQSVQQLDPAPDQAIICYDGIRGRLGEDLRTVPLRTVWSVNAHRWRYPQAYYLQRAVEAAETEWVWILDIDDIALVNALDGLDAVAADVWQMGFLRSDGERYVVPTMTNAEYLDGIGNPYVAGSAFRVDAFKEAGGFPDIAFQDWGLWRRLARAGAWFESSGRPHFHYMRHPHTRGELELTLDVRAGHLVDMFATEEFHAVA